MFPAIAHQRFYIRIQGSQKANSPLFWKCFFTSSKATLKVHTLWWDVATHSQGARLPSRIEFGITILRWTVNPWECCHWGCNVRLWVVVRELQRHKYTSMGFYS
jgi:hypothetical protein